jgi:hypothetical protein
MSLNLRICSLIVDQWYFILPLCPLKAFLVALTLSFLAPGPSRVFHHYYTTLAWFWFLAPDEILVCVEAAHSVKRKLHFADATDLCVTQGRIWIYFGLWLGQ